MNQIKIGRFIADERKRKGYTKKQLSEKIVHDIRNAGNGNWNQNYAYSYRCYCNEWWNCSCMHS